MRYDERNLSIFPKLFKLTSIKELENFIVSLDKENPIEESLVYYARSWLDVVEDNKHFVPSSYISNDLSVIRLGNCPVIFQGSNGWCAKHKLDQRQVENKLNAIYNRCTILRKQNPNKKICLVIIPEKDYVIKEFILKEQQFTAIRDSIDGLKRKLESIDCCLVFDKPVEKLNSCESIESYRYPDSHLLPACYAHIFLEVVENLGLSSAMAEQEISFKERIVYGDLSKKFSGDPLPPYTVQDPHFEGATVKQISGNGTFGKPLGKTSQAFRNETPTIFKDVVILGDSHSSIFKQRRLTYMFANSFVKTEFEWNPMDVRSEMGATTSDCIVLESSLRFLV